MRKPRLIASDMDGTLLLDWHSLSPRALPLVERLLDEGIAFMPSSGRQYTNLHRLFEPVADRLSYVAENGALAFVGREVVLAKSLPYDVGCSVIEAIQRAEGCEVMVSGRRVCYVHPKDRSFVDHLRNFVRFDVREVRDLTVIGEPFVKVAAFCKEGITNRLLDWWRECFGGRCTVSPSGNQWVDMAPLGTSKAVAMQAVFEVLGIDAADVIALGDGPNDREMFELVGCPIVMSHGDRELARLARYSTDTVDHVLERILDGPGYDW